MSTETGLISIDDALELVFEHKRTISQRREGLLRKIELVAKCGSLAQAQEWSHEASMLEGEMILLTKLGLGLTELPRMDWQEGKS